MPSERDEAADDPVIDPVLGDPRMVADPRITADRATSRRQASGVCEGLGG